MVHELCRIDDRIWELFEGWEETLIYSCLQQTMGKVYVTDREAPRSAMAFVGCFAFYAGVPDRELVLNKPDGFVIMTPQNEAWSKLIAECWPQGEKTVRYATRKDTVFDEEKLRRMAKELPDGYDMRKIDGEIYDRCLLSPATEDFVSSFGSREKYLRYGRGVVILKDGEIVAGASSYTSYRQGIEIEVDTVPSERRKNLATAACAALILDCLKDGLYPSWDAQNRISLHLAEKLGYEFSHEYEVYTVRRTE